MARGGKRPGAGRKPNPNKGKTPSAEELKIPPRTVYEPWICAQVEKLSFHGATDLEIADFLGITLDTYYRWRNEFPEFSEALALGKENADNRVVKSLYNRAVGYSFPAEKIMVVKGVVKRIAYREHVPPDPTAAMNWLRNRRKAEWRDPQDVKVSGAVGTYDLSKLDDDGLARLESILTTISVTGLDPESPDVRRDGVSDAKNGP